MSFEKSFGCTYLYRNCLQRYTKWVAFLELNGINKLKLSSLCQILAGNFLLLNGPFPEFVKCKIQHALLGNEGLVRVFAIQGTGVQEIPGYQHRTKPNKFVIKLNRTKSDENQTIQFDVVWSSNEIEQLTFL